ncbi:unnamed protein product [Didymodactylos carnosus]|uniref:FLYWCH-type domain-containing protein n=2 Tax=Didymodactylos carnosus TaxID=1234261 RepID=A0A8S2MIR7_9BILA|nr:unnamed protein product [Didymodactylos carnosus]CAF3957562.1 unnamed protein product [Didymodactylos carnosus]
MTITTKDRPLMVDDGYSYVKDRQTDIKTYWRWENHIRFNCHCRLHTCNLTNDILERKSIHAYNCNRDTTKLVLRKFDEKLNKRATSTQKATDTILCQCLTSVPDTVGARLPALKHVKITKPSLMKTNNSSEARNRRIGCLFQCSHPTLWKFIDKLCDEEDWVIRTKILYANTRASIQKKKKYQHLDKRLLNFVLNPHADIINQINNLTHNIFLLNKRHLRLVSLFTIINYVLQKL